MGAREELRLMDTGGHAPRLPSTPGVAEDGQAIRWNKTSEEFEFFTPSSGSATGAGRCAIITGTGLTLTDYELIDGTTDEISGLFLRLAKRRTFPTARSVASADSEYGWTWMNRAALSSADENTTVADACYMAHGSTATVLNAATQTGPVRYRLYDAQPGRIIEIVSRVASNGSANTEANGLILMQDGTLGNMAWIMVGYNSGPKVFSYNGSVVQTVITTTQRDQGVWVRMVVNYPAVYTFYNLANQAAPPTSWTLQQVTVTRLTDPLARIGMAIRTSPDVTGTLQGTWLYYDDSGYPSGSWLTPNPLWGGAQYDTSGPVIKLLDDYDIDADKAPNITVLRAVLQDAENRLSGDSGAWTYSFVRNASAATAVPGVYQAATALTDSGSGKYWNLWAKCTSTGNEGGSLLVSRLVIPAVA